MNVAARSQGIELAGRRLLDVAGRDLDATMPSCPGWATRDLVSHMVNVWSAIDVALANREPAPPDFSSVPTPPEDDTDLLECASSCLDRLVGAVAAANPLQPIWTWSSDQTVGFFLRRAHHETLVHRVDAELALDDRTPVDAGVALDGIDELFSVVVSAAPEDPPSGSFHLHQTDGDGEFMLAVVDGSISVTHEHAKGDAALRGTAESLWLAMWGRGTMDDMEFFGDKAIAAQWTGLAP